MNKETFVEELKKILGSNLMSVIVYGSSVRGDQIQGESDVNLLIVTDQMNEDVLRQLSKPVRKWISKNKTAPLFFKQEELLRSLDVFPIEFSEILSHHSVLTGSDVLANVTVHPTHLRWQLEYELRVKLLQWQNAFLDSGSVPKKTVSSLTALMRAVLLLQNKPVPLKKEEVWAATQASTGVVIGFKEAAPSFSDVRRVLEQLIGFVDRFKG